MIATIISQTQEKMQKAVDVTKDDLSTIRSGRATPSFFQLYRSVEE